MPVTMRQSEQSFAVLHPDDYVQSAAKRRLDAANLSEVTPHELAGKMRQYGLQADLVDAPRRHGVVPTSRTTAFGVGLSPRDPRDQDSAEAAKILLEQRERRIASQSIYSLKLPRQQKMKKASLCSGKIYGDKYVDIKYRDFNGVTRTSEVFRRRQEDNRRRADGSNSHKNEELKMTDPVERSPHHQYRFIEKFNHRPVSLKTRSFIKSMLLGDNACGLKFCDAPEEIMFDVRKQMNEGPFFSERALAEIMKRVIPCYVRDGNEQLFENAAAAFAQYLVYKGSKPRAWRHAHYESVHIPTTPRDFLVDNSETFEMSKSMQKFFTVGPAATMEDEVQQTAVATALFIRGAHLAAQQIDYLNAKHTKNVETAIAVGFAAVSAVLAGVPMGVAAGVPALFGPFRDLAVHGHQRHYTSGVLRARVEGYFTSLKRRAHGGYEVPGLDTLRDQGMPNSTWTRVDRLVHAERVKWGNFYIGRVEAILHGSESQPLPATMSLDRPGAA